MKMFSLLFLGSLLASCGSSDDPRPGEESLLHFITFGPGVTGLTSRVKQETMTACLSGVSTEGAKAWEENIKSTILKWVKPLRALTSTKLVEDVEVTLNGGSGCDLYVTVSSNVHSNTNIGQRPTVNMAPSGYFGSYNVLLHEMGHAFGLSDTYTGGQSGRCQPGQPQAVMCNTSFSDLEADDVKGMAAVFKTAFPGDKPPVDPPAPAYKLFAAIGKEISGARHELHFSVVGAPANAAGEMAVCVGGMSACGPGATWTALAKSGDRPGAALYAWADAPALAQDLQLTIRFKSAAGEARRTLNVRSGT